MVGRPRTPIEVRFAKFVGERDAAGCLPWVGTINTHGYGTFWDPDRGNVGAHRIAWEMVNGPIPDGLEIDHTCRIRRCVDVAHMEAVTRSENDRRGINGERQLVCKRGHSTLGDGAYVRPDGGRECRTCRAERMAVWEKAHPGRKKKPTTQGET
jgi:HNH endonuclease